MESLVLNGDSMVWEGIFWIIGEWSNFCLLSHYIISKDKCIRPKQCIWKDYSGTMVSVENGIILSTVVFNVRDENPLLGVIRPWTITLYEHISDTPNHTLNYVQFAVRGLGYV